MISLFETPPISSCTFINSSKMEEELLSKRFSNLESSVKRALKQMQTDGLARQLEYHKTSSSFAPNRLLEVLSDNIEAGREKFIQQLLHEIDNCAFERDKIELKFQKLRTQIASNTKTANDQSKKLKQLGIKISTQISEIQQKQASRESRYEKAISFRNDEIQKSRILFKQSKQILDSLSSQISDLRMQVSSYSQTSSRTVKSTCNKIKIETKRILNDIFENQEEKMSDSLESKRSESESVKSQTIKIQNAYSSVISYINENAAALSLSERVVKEKNGSDVESIMNMILDAKADEAIKYHLKQATVQLEDVVLDRQNFVSTSAKYYNDRLKKKEKEINEIILQAKRRRHKLKEDLMAAQNQIKSLTGSTFISEEESMKEFEQSNKELASARQMLDLTMSQLGLNVKSTKE